jgi:hypothetical protein
MRLGLWKLAKRFRLRERIGKANQWCEQHKGRTASFTMGALLISLAAGVLTSLLEGDEEHEPRFDSIAIVSPMFNGMRRIQENKDYQVSQVEKMTMRGKEIKHELDSLVGIPLKTHDDSVQIVIKYKQLEMIVRNLENNNK